MHQNKKQSIKKLLKLQNLPLQLSKCQQLGQIECLIYGHLYRIIYQGVQLYVKKIQYNDGNQELALHYVVNNNLLVLPPYVTLECTVLTKYQRKKQLLQIIYDIAELGCIVDIGLSHNRVAYSTLLKRWRIMGDIHNGLSNYQSLLKNQTKGIYFSPQLMKSLSKDRIYPKIDIKQSDVFIFGLILLQIIFQQNFEQQIFNYQLYEIKLGPILQKLINVQQLFGKQIYQIIVRMLEFDAGKRISFQQLKQSVKYITTDQCYLSPQHSRTNQLTPPVNTKSKKGSYSPSPQSIPNTNSHIEDRGRSPGTIRKNLPLPGKNAFSPIRNQSSDVIVGHEESSKIGGGNGIEQRKRVSNCCRITPNKVKIWEGMENQRPKVEPFGLKMEGKVKEHEGNVEEEKISFLKLKSMRS